MDFAQLPECNPNPSGECIHGNDDHPDNAAELVRCAACDTDYPRFLTRRWVGAAYICVDCDALANRPPTEDD